MGGAGAAYDAILRGGVMFLVVATPLALGTVHVPAIAALQWTVFALLLVWVLKAVWTPPLREEGLEAAGPAPGRRPRTFFGHPVASTGLGGPIAMFVALATIQILPMPPALVRLLSPATARLYETSLPGYGSPEGVDLSKVQTFLLGGEEDGVVRSILEAPGTLPLDLDTRGSNLRTLSAYPFATASRLGVFLTLLGLFYVVVNTYRSRTRVESALKGVVLFGFVLSVYALVQRLSWNGKIFWSIAPDPGASPFGPFINHNHYAAFIAMIVPVATGMLMDEARRLSPGRRDAGGGRGPGILALHGPEAIARLLLSAFVVGVMAATIGLSESRGAVLSLGAAFLLYGGALAVQGRLGRAEALIAVVLVALALGLSLWLGIGPLVERLAAISDMETEPSMASRLTAWRWTLRIIGDHPLLGTGLGTFSESWSRYYPPGTAGIWHEAHNDYLQFLAETGVVGFVIFAAGFSIFLWRYVRPGLMTRRRQDSYSIHGLAVGILAVAMHEFVDFPLQINACAVLFVVMSGLLLAYRKRMETWE